VFQLSLSAWVWVTLTPALFIPFVFVLGIPTFEVILVEAPPPPGISGSLSAGNQIHCPQDLGNSHGSLQPDVAAEPTRGLRTAQNPAVAFPEEELSEAGKAHPLAQHPLASPSKAASTQLHLLPPACFQNQRQAPSARLQT
jgi:hypothetical protein